MNAKCYFSSDPVVGEMMVYRLAGRCYEGGMFCRVNKRTWIITKPFGGASWAYAC